MTRITAITTCYREGPLLGPALRSVLAQQGPELEVLLVADGADAATLAEAEGLCDPRLRLLRQANDGLSSARNRALEQARGDWICFLDADDLRPPWALARMLAAAGPAELVLCPGHLSEPDDSLHPFYDRALLDQLAARPSDDPLRRPLAQLSEPQSANKLIRRSLIARHRLRFPNGHFFEDILFHTLAVTHARGLAVSDSPGFTYHRRHGHRQITGGADTRRFDTLAVTRMTLQRVAAEARDPLLRLSVLLSCARLIQWSESVIAHPHRAAFRDMTVAMLALSDPIYRVLPALPEPLAPLAPLHDWLSGLLRDPRLPPHPQEIPHVRPGFRQRLWPQRRA
ncbi:glycosyltransferase [Pseudooceanicola sp. CBS1P-1]|uniref:Glycosyltransferase n=1 Tax=Pseudooceanicola albus TaxID=2692189 RepID=A0A6L7GA29_9RHOB|nr:MULTISPECIES: glycosyltransferase [Pseudooceanicola]MBT9386519.1 glycosyltransferase [Pseudooceanicola endophyticus]MXN20552.1 glycosyltransferase [Pseudooceanicola albus]